MNGFVVLSKPVNADGWNIEFVSLDRRAADTERRALARENRSLRLSVKPAKLVEIGG